MYLLSVLIFILLIPGALSAATLADKVQEHQLKNGIKLLLVERHNSPTVAAYISFRVGGVDEQSQHQGVAHLLEHMLFKGTQLLGTRDYRQELPLLEQIEAVGGQIDALKNRPEADPQQLVSLRAQLLELQDAHRKLVIKDEFSKIYSENGGVGYNAFTSKDQTTYLINLPANKLELWASIESDRLKNAVLREFYTERDVVLEERRRSYESSPDGKLYETLLATAYKVHPYRNPVIGWPADIDNLTPDEARSFFGNYYAPANMIITLVGDFKGAAALRMVENYFGQLPPGVPVPPVVQREPEQTGERRVDVDYECSPQMAIAYHKPTLPQRDDYVFDLLMQILAEGRTSRLYQSLVIEKNLISGLGIYGAPGSRYDNLMVLNLSPRQGHSYAEVEEALYAEIQRMQTEPVTTAELEKARKQILTSQLRRLKDNSGLARMLSSYEVLGGWRYLVDYQQQLDSITREEVLAVASRYLVVNNRTVVTIGQEVAQ